MTNIVLVRHGETEWSRNGQHTGRTDIALTDVGRRQATDLSARLRAWSFAHVFTSPAQRATATAQLAGIGESAVIEHDLVEWDYGDDEGRTTMDIRVERPGWTVFNDGPSNGESLDALTARVDSCLARIRLLLDEGDIALVGHGHTLRVLAARWIGLGGREGRLLALDPATISVLGYEREQPVIKAWNGR